ncbi:MAG: hypothetical protein LBB34_02585 [Holosporales bacterium]|nr:hypothetical protein [Holosporales bacterium]
MSEIFENISIDMIYNRPKQSLQSWRDELKNVVSFPINHMSLYELIVEDDTPIKKSIDSGILPSTDKSDRFFEETVSLARRCGFEMYEVSNFAKIPHTKDIIANDGDIPYGRHNVSYWKYEDYYGVGPGSHSRARCGERKVAIAQIVNNKDWLQWAKNPVFDMEILNEYDEFKERILMGLRSKWGVNFGSFSENVKGKYDLQNKLQNLAKNSYIMVDDGVVVLSHEGLLRLNLVVRYLVGSV